MTRLFERASYKNSKTQGERGVLDARPGIFRSLNDKKI